MSPIDMRLIGQVPLPLREGGIKTMAASSLKKAAL